MKRLFIALGAATTVFFIGSWIVVATVGNKDHGVEGVIGGIFWFGFLLLGAALVVAVLVALVRSRLGRAAATMALLVLALAAVAAAATTRGGAPGRPLRFTIYSANVANRDQPLLVEATGAVAGIGSATAKDDAPNQDVPLTFTFPHGKVFLTAHDPFSWKPNLATCTATADSRGPFTITGGTGAYRGITGHGRFVEHGAAIGVRASNGSCQQRFTLNYVVATATGTAVTRS